MHLIQDISLTDLTLSYSASLFGLPVRTLLSLGRYLILPILPRLCLTGFTFSQPFLTTALIQYLSDSTASKNDGYGLVGASFLVYGGIAVSIICILICTLGSEPMLASRFRTVGTLT